MMMNKIEFLIERLKQSGVKNLQISDIIYNELFKEYDVYNHNNVHIFSLTDQAYLYLGPKVFTYEDDSNPIVEEI